MVEGEVAMSFASKNHELIFQKFQVFLLISPIKFSFFN